MTRTIVILGASYAGLVTAHKLLKHTFPSVPDIKVILVSLGTHFFWNIATVRAIIPGQLPDESILQPISPGFAQYPEKSFELIVGRAESLDPDKNEVLISTAGGNVVQNYDMLVLATGADSIGDAPWKPKGSYDETKKKLHEVQERIKSAHSILVAGAGVTGIEVAGELGYEYGKTKEIILAAAGESISLDRVPKNVSKSAQSQLENLNVKILLKKRVISATTTPNGQTEVMFEDGGKEVTDLYLPTVGLRPNSNYIPHDLLNTKGEVKVDEALRVISTTNIWAAGDVSDAQPNQLLIAEKQAITIAKNLDLVLKNKQPVAYKSNSGADTLAITIGRRSGTGVIGSFKVPGPAIWMVKGRTFFVEKMGNYVTGSGY